MKVKIINVFILNIFLLLTTPTFADEKSKFNNWIEVLKNKAKTAKISKKTIKKVFPTIKYKEKIIKKDRSQLEFVSDFWDYYDKLVSEERIEEGIKMRQKYWPLLQKIKKQYNIQPRFIIAFWGAESFYGKFKGKNNIFTTLATLSYDQRRRDYFTKEFINALKIADKKDININDLKGSWAGAIGHFQFMPATYLTYAVDGDNDGKIDVINSFTDAAYSAGNYLSTLGWKGDEFWGRQVVVTKNFNWDLVGLKTKKTLPEWNRAGVRTVTKTKLPNIKDMQAALIAPNGKEGPIFLVYDNFFNIMKWNRSIFYAIAVGRLADRIGFFPPLTGEKYMKKDNKVTIKQIKEIQNYLKFKNYYNGEIDGIIGSKLRGAVQNFQKNNNLTPDAYIDKDLYEFIF